MGISIGQFCENKRCLDMFKGSFLEYNVYIPLLIRQANDVEENAGKQCVAMSLTAIIYYQIEHVCNWTSSTLTNILTIGNNPYISINQWISSYTTDHKIVLDHIYIQTCLPYM